MVVVSTTILSENAASVCVALLAVVVGVWVTFFRTAKGIDSSVVEIQSSKEETKQPIISTVVTTENDDGNCSSPFAELPADILPKGEAAAAVVAPIDLNLDDLDGVLDDALDELTATSMLDDALDCVFDDETTTPVTSIKPRKPIFPLRGSSGVTSRQMVDGRKTAAPPMSWVDTVRSYVSCEQVDRWLSVIRADERSQLSMERQRPFSRAYKFRPSTTRSRAPGSVPTSTASNNVRVNGTEVPPPSSYLSSLLHTAIARSGKKLTKPLLTGSGRNMTPKVCQQVVELSPVLVAGFQSQIIKDMRMRMRTDPDTKAMSNTELVGRFPFLSATITAS